MPTQVVWPMPSAGALPDGLVGQRAARETTDADAAGRVDVAGHDADLALAGRDDAGAVGADQDAIGVPWRARLTRPCPAPGCPR